MAQERRFAGAEVAGDEHGRQRLATRRAETFKGFVAHAHYNRVVHCLPFFSSYPID
jgi:hypothetical protein